MMSGVVSDRFLIQPAAGWTDVAKWFAPVGMSVERKAILEDA